MQHKTFSIIRLLKKIWKQILHLPFGRRLSFFSIIAGIIFLFFPWFYEGSQSFSAFGKSFIFASIILFLSVFSLLIILREIFSHVGTLGNFRHSDILVFTFSQSLFTIILANASLSMLLLEKPAYMISNLGIMLTFVSLGVGLAGVFFARDFTPLKKENKQVFVDKDLDLSHSNIEAESKLSLGEYDKK